MSRLMVPERVKRFIQIADDMLPNWLVLPDWSERRFVNRVVRRHNQAGDTEPITITGGYRHRSYNVSSPRYYVGENDTVDSVVLSLRHEQSGRRPIQYSREISSAPIGELPPQAKIWELAKARAEEVGQKISRRGHVLVNVSLFGVPLDS